MSNKELTVYKANALIDAGYRLTVMEQRIILACIAKLAHDEQITDEYMYSVSAKEIAELADISERNIYNDLKNAALRLKRREVRVEYEANGGRKKPRKRIFGWVQTIDYIDDESRIELRFNKDMLPYLTMLTSHFTKYKLKAVAKMDSSHAIRFYELLMKWQTQNEHEFEMEWLRSFFGLEDTEYKVLADFKKRVIDIAIKQINQFSDLIITLPYGQRKTGRAVTHLTFIFNLKPDVKVAKEQLKPKSKLAVKRIIKPVVKSVTTNPKPTTLALPKTVREPLSEAAQKARAEIQEYLRRRNPNRKNAVG